MRTKIFYSLAGLAAVLLLAVYLGFYFLAADLPHIPDDLRHLVYAQPTEIYADDGSLVYRLGGQSYVTLDQISPYFQQAVVATEDGNFYRHHGLDKLALLRAVYATTFRGRTQGASTISQQLAKNLFFSFRKLFLRKLKDMLVAIQLESMFSKEQILEAYCNLIYFGGTAYGVEDAAQQFFDKSAIDLTLAEAALLAGIINSPQALNPISHPDAARQRQFTVLSRMRRRHYIDAAAVQAALADTLHYVPRRNRSNDFIDYTLSLAEEAYGKEAVYFGGLKIYTSLDPDLQNIAEEELALGVRVLDSELDSTGTPLQGAMAVIAVPTGEVKALVGSREYVPGSFNRAVSDNRHVGSGVKPFIYATAMEKLDLTPISLVMDTLPTFRLPNGKTWQPRNFDRKYRGQLILKSALVQSLNAVSAQLGNQLTPHIMAESLRRFGITSSIPEVLPLSLGTVGISPLEMATGYAVFARNGIYYHPVFIRRVEDLNGIVLDRAIVFGEQRLDEKIAYETLDMMTGVVDEGTGQSVRFAGFTAPAAGKTGTSTEYTDAWFNGITTALSASVWVGYDKIYQMYRKDGRGVTGGYGAGPIWANFMRRASERYPARNFHMPAGLKRVYVHPVYGWEVIEPADGMPAVIPERNIPPAPATDGTEDPRWWQTRPRQEQ